MILIILGIKANRSDNIMRIFGYSFSVVATDSMEDTIMAGDMIFIKSVPFQEIEEDDIIVFGQCGEQIHRPQSRGEGRREALHEGGQSQSDA